MQLWHYNEKGVIKLDDIVAGLTIRDAAAGIITVVPTEHADGIVVDKDNQKFILCGLHGNPFLPFSNMPMTRVEMLAHFNAHSAYFKKINGEWTFIEEK